MPHEEQTRSLPGLPLPETESRMQSGQADDISEVLIVSEEHNDDQDAPVSPDEPVKPEPSALPSNPD